MPRFHISSSALTGNAPPSVGFEVDAENWMVATDLASRQLGLSVDALGHLQCDVDGAGVISVSDPSAGLALRIIELAAQTVPTALPCDPSLVDAPEPVASLDLLRRDAAADALIEALVTEVGRIDAGATVDHACALALEVLLRVVPAQSGSVVLLRDAGETLEFVAATGPHRSRIVGRRMPASQGIVGMSIRGGRSVLVRLASHHPAHYALIDRELNHQTQALLVAPIRGGSGITGAVELINPIGGQEFVSWHRDAAMLVAGGLGRRLAALSASPAGRSSPAP